MKFSHLHVHTQYSLLDGAASIQSLYKKAIADGMPALAISDHGNMFGVFEFVAEAYKHKDEKGNLKVKPIVGCEFYITIDRHRKTFSKDERDPRTIKFCLQKMKKVIAALSSSPLWALLKECIASIRGSTKNSSSNTRKVSLQPPVAWVPLVPQAILKKSEAEAENEFKWWLDIFGDDYYVELQRHGLAEQNKVNEILVKFAAKYKVKIIASNDSHYVDQADLQCT